MMEANRFRATIKARMEECEVRSLRELAGHTSANYRTFMRHWKEPGQYPAQVVSEICDFLTMPTEERGRLI